MTNELTTTGRGLKVLDHGFVRLEAHQGGDNAVVRAARVSYGGNTPPDEARDPKLIQYLLKNDHGSPFEHCHFEIHVRAPILVFRQWHRHRIGVSYNELSARYTELKEEFYTPATWRAQDTVNRQGSVAADMDHASATAQQANANRAAWDAYQNLLKLGVAREMARMVLPVSIYSEMYFSANARSLMAFIRLRSDAHAQWETRQYSHAMARIFYECMPWTYAAMNVEMEKDEAAGKRDYGELRQYMAQTGMVAA
jgi:thymidylate synthase (FAD)